MAIFAKMASSYGLVGSFILVTVVMMAGYSLAGLIHQKRMGAAFSILLALVVAWVGGVIANGQQAAYGAELISSVSHGITDVKFITQSGSFLAIFGGIGILGGGMMRDYTIISTAWGVKGENIIKAGLAGFIALLLGLIISYLSGVGIGYAFGYRDPYELATIGAGVQTFVVGPVTGTAFQVGSDVIALSIAAGVVKSVVVMILAPLLAPKIGLKDPSYTTLFRSPSSAMIFGGLMGTTSGVAGGLAAVDASLVPYGAMVATFYTGLGCLLTPTLFANITAALIH